MINININISTTSTLRSTSALHGSLTFSCWRATSVACHDVLCSAQRSEPDDVPPAAIACCRRRALRTHATSPVRPASRSRSDAFALKPHAKVMFMEQSHCSVRLPLFCTCPPQCLGALWPMPAWVWRDVRSGFCYFFTPHISAIRQPRQFPQAAGIQSLLAWTAHPSPSRPRLFTSPSRLVTSTSDALQSTAEPASCRSLF